MRNFWWKALGAVLVLYSVLAGLLVPLKPGIESLRPERAEAGDLLVLRATGYNTRFDETSGDIRAWLKLSEEYAIGANQVLVQDDKRIRISFSLPAEFPLSGTVHPLTLILNDPVHGSMVTPGAVFVRECKFSERSRNLWAAAPITGLSEVSGFKFPYRTILYETIRNTYFHVPMWFAMIVLFFASAYYSLRYTRQNNLDFDSRASAFARVGVLLGVLGLLTGMIWSNYTWGAPWSWDVKQNTSAIALLIYFAYFVLRKSFDEMERRARIAAVYNIFACAMLIPLLFVIPRMTDSLHPGSGGNPAMGGEDLDNTMRMVFYPAVVGWILLGLWVSQLLYRVKKLEFRMLDAV